MNRTQSERETNKFSFWLVIRIICSGRSPMFFGITSDGAAATMCVISRSVKSASTSSKLRGIPLEQERLIVLSSIIHNERDVQGDWDDLPAEIYGIVYDRNEVDELELRGCNRFIVQFLPGDVYRVVLCRRIFALLKHLELVHKAFIRHYEATP